MLDTDEDISGGLNMVITEHLLREDVPWLLVGAVGRVVVVVVAAGDVLWENASWFLVEAMGRVLLVVAVVEVSCLQFPVVSSMLTEELPKRGRKTRKKVTVDALYLSLEDPETV